MTATHAPRTAVASASRFLLVGSSNVAIGFVVVWVGVRLPFDSAYKAGVAQLAAYAIAAVWSFMWNRRWTFRSVGAPIAGQAWRFAATQVALAFASSALLSLAVDRQRWHLGASWFVVTAFTTVANFVASRYWVFR